MLSTIVLLFAQAATTPQIDRGQAYFLDPSQGCASCHALQGKGTAVGPDLGVMGRLPPGAIAVAVRSTLTQYVQKVKVKSTKETFPGMPAKADGKSAFYDVSKNPPELRVLDKSDIQAVTANDQWKHPPGVAKIAPERLADIIAYIRWATTGARTHVDPAEAQ
jgi:hypothetical protein